MAVQVRTFMEGFCLVGIGSAVTEGFGMARRVLVGFGCPGSDRHGKILSGW